MREIKFRAWDKKQNRMLKYENDVCPCITLNGVCQGENHTNVSFDYVLQQFVGSIDKNNKEIYEGDIVKCPLSENSEDYLVLEASKNKYVVRTISIPEVYQEGLPDDCEIIGNIYKDGHLLK